MCRLVLIVSILAILLTAGSVFGVEEFKITADDAAAGDYFGWSVSISGDYAIVGAYFSDDDGENSGSAYIFVREGEEWIQQQKLTADDAAAGDEFGQSVSISGDYAIVGAYGNDDEGNETGSAYIFMRVGEEWTQQQKLTADDAAADDLFGVSVSISGDYSVVGAAWSNDDGDRSGSAYIFVRNGEEWTQQQKMTADDASAGDQFGGYVSLSGDYAIVSANYDADDGENSGSAYIFMRAGEEWTQQQKLTADDAAAGDYFGNRVSISDDYAIVGASGNDDDGENSGSAYIFMRDGEEWMQQQKLTADDAAAGDMFGRPSLSGDYAIVGATRNNDDGQYSGSAYIFVRDGEEWTQQQKLTADDAAAGDLFGCNVFLSGDYAIVGAYQNDDDGERSGSAYVYTMRRDQPENLAWWINLSTTVENHNDNDNYTGGAEEATFDFDVNFDFPEPPHAPHGYIQLYMPHPEWENDLGDNFSSDIVPDNAQWEVIIVWDFEVNTDQVDQAVTLSFNYNEEIDQDFNLVLVDVEAEEAVNLWENDSYEYNSGEGGVHEFQLIYGDLVPPELTITAPNGGENLHPTENVNITWEATDLTGVVASVVSYSIDRGETWTEIGSTEGEVYNLAWEVPDLYSPYCLIKVECTDLVDNIGTDQSDEYFAITPQSSAYNFAAGWNLISIPLDPEDNRLEALFSDDIENQYHVYDYDQTRGFARVDEIDCSPGYWLATYDNVSLDIEGSAYIDTITFDLDEGWNLIGDPLLWLTPLDSILFRVGETTYSLEDAVDEELVLPILYNWLAANHNYTEEEVFSPWLGYWFSVLEADVEMLIYPVIPTEEEERDNSDELSPESWMLTIAVTTDHAADMTTTLGVDTLASNGFDPRFDYPEPPSPPGGDFVSAYFRHAEWNNIIGERYNHDVRSDLSWGESANWTITVVSSDTGEVTLSWSDILNNVPEDYRFVIEDLTTGQRVNMLDNEFYLYNSTGIHRFNINVEANKVEDTDQSLIPDEFSIISINPNPFNSMTTITYTLPTKTRISLSVYDLYGREVVSLIDGDVRIGRHSIVLNSEGLASGIYFVRLVIPGRTVSRKILLVR